MLSFILPLKGEAASVSEPVGVSIRSMPATARSPTAADGGTSPVQGEERQRRENGSYFTSRAKPGEGHAAASRRGGVPADVHGGSEGGGVHSRHEPSHGT